MTEPSDTTETKPEQPRQPGAGGGSGAGRKDAEGVGAPAGADDPEQAAKDRAAAAIAASREALKKELFQAIDLFREINRRLPLLRGFEQEIQRRRGSPDKPDLLVRNMAVFQLLHDSFDMLVIDLVSLRKKFIREDGLFYALMDHSRAFRRFEPKDFSGGNVLWVGNPADDPGEQFWRDHLWKEQADRLNAVFEEFFPGEGSVREKDLDALRLKFRDETQPLADDRNKLRAHRYEKHADLSVRLPLSEVEKQIEIFKYYLQGFLRLADRSSYDMTPHAPGADAASEDLVDLVVLCSINDATLRYGLARKLPDQRAWWYWRCREEFFKSGGSIAGKLPPYKADIELEREGVLDLNNASYPTWVEELREVFSADEANRAIRDGWKLLAIHQRTLSGPGGVTDFSTRYVLGRGTPESSDP